ncbi:MAG TPA: glucosamine-6-phosphate deaminase [Phycisphaerales bacterium]|mgnify:CR=1 FL=1|nr:glucosamine-6-phosphate deaminase [Phycisphaerales bacterium]
MQTFIHEAKAQMGAAAGRQAAEAIAAAIAAKGSANIILATGASQFEMLAALVAAPGVDWSVVSMFHLDEYIGLGAGHPASFRKYLKERFVGKVPALKAAHLVNGDAADPAAECRRLGELIRAHPIDVACVGIGENGHLAFNDPPADFETDEPYLAVKLDEKCRRQQLGEGWFPTLEDVPRVAISMSVRQIMNSRTIICSVPDTRKAEAVKAALEGPVTNLCPASILREHGDCRMFLDRAAASLLKS